MTMFQRFRVRRAETGSAKRVYIRSNQGKRVVGKLFSWYSRGEYLIIRVDAVEFLVERGRVVSNDGDVLGAVTFDGDVCIIEISPDWIAALRSAV